MTGQVRDFDDILGRALHSAVDSIEPSDDGLDKIRRRLTEPWLLRQWRLLLAECRELAWLLLVRLEPVPLWARSHLRVPAVMATHLRQARSRARELARLAARISHLPRYDAVHRNQAGGQDGTRLRTVLSRLRPVLAVGAAVVIVVAGVFALTQLRTTISDIGLTGPNVSTPGSAKPSPSGAGHKSSHKHRHRRSAVGHDSASLLFPPPAFFASPTPSCTPTPTPAAGPTPSASTTGGAANTNASTSPSATASATATSTASGTGAVAPAATAGATASVSPTATTSTQKSASTASPGATSSRQPCG